MLFLWYLFSNSGSSILFFPYELNNLCFFLLPCINLHVKYPVPIYFFIWLWDALSYMLSAFSCLFTDFKGWCFVHDFLFCIVQQVKQYLFFMKVQNNCFSLWCGFPFLVFWMLHPNDFERKYYNLLIKNCSSILMFEAQSHVAYCPIIQKLN